MRVCMMHLVVPSCIRGYHVYGEIWTAVLNEQLSCESEIGTGTQWQRRMTWVLQWGTCHGKYLDIFNGGRNNNDYCRWTTKVAIVLIWLKEDIANSLITRATKLRATFITRILMTRTRD